MKRGDKVRGVDLGDGCPVKDGEVYTVSYYGPYRGIARASLEVPSRHKCVTVKELRGYFWETRFEAMT